MDYIKLDDNHAIFEVKVPKEWIGKSVREVDIRKKYGINIMAIKRDGDMNIAVLPDMVFEREFSLLVLGEHKAIQKCFHI